MEPIIELTPKGQEMFKKLFSVDFSKVDRQQELAALAHTAPGDEWVVLKASGLGNMTRLMNKGWELLHSDNTTPYVLVRVYTMRKKRTAVDLDINEVELVK